MNRLLHIRFDELKPKYKEAIIAQVRDRMLAKRNALIERFGQEVADNCWWAKLDYINNWTYENDTLFATCENCGLPTDLMVCISDVPAPYESRFVTWRCPCGQRHESYE